MTAKREWHSDREGETLVIGDIVHYYYDDYLVTGIVYGPSFTSPQHINVFVLSVEDDYDEIIDDVGTLWRGEDPDYWWRARNGW